MKKDNGNRHGMRTTENVLAKVNHAKYTLEIIIMERRKERKREKK